MSYGVNKWGAGNGRAAGAAKRKKAARRTAKRPRSGSAPRAKKKSRKKPATRKAAPKKRVSKKRAKKSTRAKKERLYTRYDPETGQKVRVTKDTFEYAEWPSRKPSKKKLQRESLKRDPLGTGSQIVTEAVKKSAARSVERSAGQLTRGVSKSLAVGGAATAARTVALGAGAAALVGAAIYAMGKLVELRDVQLGEKANRISREFVATQKAVMKQYGVGTWEQVPADVRNKLVSGYKSAIAKVYSGVHQGVFKPSQQIPYGR